MKKYFRISALTILLLLGCQLFAQQATVYTTAKNTKLRITKTDTKTFTDAQQPFERQACIFVDTNKKFQKVIGIGSALTDASAETFYKLPADLQEKLITSFYDKEKGIAYSFARTSIHSCDFSSESYTYVHDNDSLLKSFDISHDLKFRIPLIKKAIAAAGGKLTLMVSPWSPPAWMKDNNNMLQGGSLLPQYFQSWANYYVKFIKAYEAENIPIFGLTVQNEPMAKQTWESCIYTAKQEADFVKNYLGPTLHKAGMADKKVIIWDHNRDLLYQRAKDALNDTLAAKYIWGVGYHWYETWTGSDMMFENVRNVKQTFPDKHLIFTEGCVEKFDMKRVKDWTLGEKYAYSMINDFKSGVEGWLDWNIFLDEKGGPNHVGNYCFAPVIIDTQKNKLIYTNIYYYMGQFSKFVQPGAQRIISSSNRGELLTTAFVNPDNKIVIVVMNNSEKTMDYHLFVNNKETQMSSLPNSISTMIIE